jgi:hypothetical protein
MAVVSQKEQRGLATLFFILQIATKMKKLVLAVFLTAISLVNSYGQTDYTVHGTIDVTNSQEETRKSFETPVGSPDFDFIERQLDNSNSQYRINHSETSRGTKNPNAFISSSYEKSVWNNNTHVWNESSMIQRTTTIYRMTDGFKIDNDPDNAEFYSIIQKDTAADNSNFSFIKWICQDSHKKHYQVSFFLDKGRNLLWFCLRYYDKEGYPYL